ncbi:MAG: C-terminal binding protein [Candidatus Binatia bacterium]
MGRYKVVFCGKAKMPLVELEQILSGAEAALTLASPRTEDEVIQVGRDADGMIIHGRAMITPKVVNGLQRCRIISKTGVGVDKIDVNAATARGIIITNVPGVSVPEVSDHAMALILALSRGIVRVWDLVRAGRWTDEGKPEMTRLRGPVYRLEGRTLGIVGLGRIGSSVAKKAQAFGMEVIAFDPLVSPEKGSQMGVKMLGLEDLLKIADFVTIHAPLITETQGLINAEKLALMKPTAYLINAARGPIVDFKALYKALAEKKIAGAGLDVTDPEPLPTNSPFYKLDNIIITGHTAANSEESIAGVILQAARDVAAVLKGEIPASVVNPEALRTRGL